MHAAPYDSEEGEIAVAETLADYADMVLAARVTGLAMVRVHPWVVAMELVILNGISGGPAVEEEPHDHPVDMFPVSAVEQKLLAVRHGLADRAAVVGGNTAEGPAGSMTETNVGTAVVEIAQCLVVFAAEILEEVDTEAPT